MKPIHDRRRKIDGIDERLVALLNRRTQLAIEIGAFKRRYRLSAVSPAREREILRRVCETNAGPLGPKAVARLFRAILTESRRAAAVSTPEKNLR
jgi:chorismate mutase/prephenate dehydratase